jgi:leucyl aminopeptidase (aminopeptidase T)
MEQTALAADYAIIGPRTHYLAEKLSAAQAAHVRFDTGHTFTFDLRYRQARADDGMCRRTKSAPRVINLPSGEAYIAPYEGEQPDEPSQTSGQIPMLTNEELLILHIIQNRIVEIEGAGSRAAELRAYFALDHARRNIAELGLGCNDKAVVWGNVLEDEKAGFHWAYGRSEHIGGVIGPAAFLDPGHIIHQDIVYAKGSPIMVASLTLDLGDGISEEIMRDGWYINI